MVTHPESSMATSSAAAGPSLATVPPRTRTESPSPALRLWTLRMVTHPESSMATSSAAAGPSLATVPPRTRTESPSPALRLWTLMGARSLGSCVLLDLPRTLVAVVAALATVTATPMPMPPYGERRRRELHWRLRRCGSTASLFAGRSRTRPACSQLPLPQTSYLWRQRSQAELFFSPFRCPELCRIFRRERRLPRRHEGRAQCCGRRSVVLWQTNSPLTPHCMETVENGPSVRLHQKVGSQ
ncbi:hypothetical protein DFJ73DRAFT_2791 [Zopfochytrium polystomum]|nr:hypothetical protein DFJ73DRAFT_2791 [Zopfochytrium polystomum]